MNVLFGGGHEKSGTTFSPWVGGWRVHGVGVCGWVVGGGMGGWVQPITVNQLQTLIFIHLHWCLLNILGIIMIFRDGWSILGSRGRK